MTMKKMWALSVLLMCAGTAFAQVDPMALAAESAAYAKETAGDPITPQMVMERVNEAAALLEAEGLSAVDQFKGKGSRFIFGGTYMAIRDEDGIEIMHPIKPKMEGRMMLGNTDANGKPFYAEEHNIITTKGSGWFSYAWAKPGEKMPSPKVAYTKSFTIDGKLYCVTCGIYDVPEDKIEELVAGNY